MTRLGEKSVIHDNFRRWNDDVIRRHGIGDRISSVDVVVQFVVGDHVIIVLNNR